MDVQKDLLLQKFNDRKKNHNITFELKHEQLLVALAVVNGKDCMGFLPTGFGKTLCFVLNSILADTATITLIISPLLSLMDVQLQTFRSWNIACEKISGDLTEEVRRGIIDGDFSVVLASPEAILKHEWRRVFRGTIWQQRLNCIVIDEAHCISEWGDEFRPEYRDLCQLRSSFKVPVLAVTGTSTAQIKEDIIKFLHLQPDNTEIISKSPDRANIFISCQKKLSNAYEQELSFLIDHIIHNGVNSKKCLIYCRSIGTVSEVFCSLKLALALHAYKDCAKHPDNLLVEMFHKSTHEETKDRILATFARTNSTIRVVVATVALGMGVDIPDVDMVIHIGCPKSVVSYWQEAGRCARDGRDGLSHILYDNMTAALKTTDKSMRNIVKNESDQCLRRMIMEVFAISPQDKKGLHVPPNCTGCDVTRCICPACSCCSVCCKRCPCSSDRLSLLDVNTFLNKY